MTDRSPQMPPGPHPPTTAPRCGCLLGWAETWTTFHPPNKPQPPRSIHVARRTARLVPSFIASPSSQLVYHTVSAVPVLQTLAANPVQVDQVSSLSQVFPASVLARSFVFRHLPSLPRAAHRPPAADMTGDSGLVMRPSTPPALLSWAAGGGRGEGIEHNMTTRIASASLVPRPFADIHGCSRSAPSVKWPSPCLVKLQT